MNDTNEPTREEVNRALHEFLGKCWHRCNTPDEDWWCCEEMERSNGRLGLITSNPDYCSDSSPRSLLNEVVAKVIEDFSPLRYHRALYTVVPIKDKRASLVERTSELIRATAEQIARSCYLAIKEQK